MFGRILNRKRSGVVILLLLFIVSPILTTGCAASTPIEAAKKFITGIDTNNWNAFMESVLPEETRKMTQEDVQYWRERVLPQVSEAYKFNVEKLKFKVRPEGKNKALVKIVEGKIVIIKGSKSNTDLTIDAKTETSSYIDAEKKQIVTEKFSGEKSYTLEFPVEKFKSGWYVRIPLSRSGETSE